MTHKVFLLAVLCVAVQVAVAEKAAEAPKLDEVLAKAQTALGNMANELQKALGVEKLPAPEQLAKTLLDQSKDLAAKVGTIVTDLQQEISAHPDINSAVSAVARKLNETVHKLQNEAPDVQTVQAKATEIQKQLQTGLQTLVTESQKLAASFSGEFSAVQADITKISKTALDQVINTANTVQEEVKKAISTPSANV